MSKFQDTLAYRYCNPMNIRYSKSVKWQGQTTTDHPAAFVKFKDFQWGYRAAVKILRSYAKRNIKTIGKIIETWAPPTENDTTAYIKTVLDYLNARSSVNETKPVASTKRPSDYENENSKASLQGRFGGATLINLRDREEVINLLMAMTKVEMGANAAQLNSLKPAAYIGYDLAVTEPGFFTPP